MPSITDELDSYSRSTGPRKKGFRLGATIDTSRLSQLGCGARCCKLSLMGLSIFLVCTGIAVLAGGAYAMNNVDVVSAIGNDFTNCILAFGVILIVIGSVGLAGAMNESRAVLACFLLIMGLMTLTLLIFGAWALSNLGKETNILSRAWQQMSQDQKNHIEAAYNCCGATYFGSSTDVSQCPAGCQSKDVCSGCFSPMITDFRNLYSAFGAIFIIVSGIMIVTLVTAFCLMSGIANAEEAKAGGKKKARG